MRKAKLKTNYGHLHDDEVSPVAHGVVAQTAASSYISHGSTLAQPLSDAVAALDAATALTAHPTQQQTAERNVLRTAVREEMGTMAVKLNLDFTGNEAALLSSGLELAEVPTRHREVGVPTDLTLTDAPVAGYLRPRCKRPAGALVTMWRYTTDAALPEAQWLVAFGPDAALGPFASGTRVGVKAAALTGSTREPAYTAVVWRIVQ